MIGLYIFLGILFLGMILFIIWYINLVLVPVIKMQKSGIGKRTKFIINTSDKGYEYYKNIIEKWLSENKFSKYSRKYKGRVLKYHAVGNIFKFGFNYYKENENIIIETWLLVLGNENPLTLKTYTYDEGKVDITSGITTGNFKSDGQIPIAVNQQGKDEYIEFLKTFINVPEVMQESNIVTLKNRFDMSKARNQKNEKKFTKKLILIILGISLVLTFILYIPSIKEYINMNKMATTEELLRAEEFLLSNYESLIIKNKSKEVIEYGNKYYVSYIFYGTMDTPEAKNDNVIILVSNSEYSPYYVTNDEIEWSITIRQNMPNDGKKWDYSFKEYKL